jgi:hypothetical protein
MTSRGEHWVHLRTTNQVESTFATVRNRSKITKGPGSRAAGIAMAYKLIEATQSRWRAVNAPTWSPSSAPEPNSRTANPSNDPTNQEVKVKPRNTPIHRPPILLRVKRRRVREALVAVRRP